MVYVWQNYDFYVRVPIEQSFDKTFLFLSCYKVVQKTILESSISHNGDPEKCPMVWNLGLVPQLITTFSK